jgi:hypothetical protein
MCRYSLLLACQRSIVSFIDAGQVGCRVTAVDLYMRMRACLRVCVGVVGVVGGAPRSLFPFTDQLPNHVHCMSVL